MELPRLRELRKARGLSQLKVALDLNMSQNSISRYETGEHEPGLKELISLADYYDVSIDYLLHRTDNPCRPSHPPPSFFSREKKEAKKSET